MKHVLAATSLALSLSFGAAFAQQTTPTPDVQPPAATEGGHHHHAPDPQRQAEHLAKKLNLTPDQTAKIEPILVARDQQMQALHANAQLTEADRHTQMRSINDQTQQQMSGILTSDQMTQLKAMHHGGHHGHGQEGEANQTPSA